MPKKKTKTKKQKKNKQKKTNKKTKKKCDDLVMTPANSRIPMH